MKFKKIKIMLAALGVTLLLPMNCFAKGEAPKISSSNSINNISSTDIIYHVEEVPDISSDKFSSGSETDSHQYFTGQAIKTLANDKGQDKTSVIFNHKKLIMQYADMPDIDEKDSGFAYHFYDPYTGKNYLPDFAGVRTTALDKFKEHSQNAVRYYNSDKTMALKELGRACHFLEDVNVPHHASNLIAVLSTHSQYERYVNGRNPSYGIEHSNAYDKFSNQNFTSYCDSVLNDCAKNAYHYKDLANDKAGIIGHTENWETAAKATTRYAQENVAAFLYRYLQAVGEVK